MRAELSRRWGCSAVNRAADGAGGYRRIAVGMGAIPFPLGVVAADSALTEGPSPLLAGAAHLVVAVGCGLLAIDLFRSGSALRATGLPHPSSVVLLAGIALLVVLARVESTDSVGLPTLFGAGLAVLVGGFIVLMSAERQRDRLLSVFGRWAVVIGAALTGATQVARSISGFADAPTRAIGLGLVAVVLVSTAWCEARVLLRGAALYRALAQR